MGPVDAARSVRERGYAILRDVHGPEVCAHARRVVVDVWDALGQPPLQSAADEELGPDVVVDPVGMVVAGLLGRAPEVGRLLLHPRVIAPLEELLGPTPQLEMVCGVLSDGSRPFFFWHNHAGGIDGARLQRDGSFVRPPEIQRVVCTTYFAPVDDEYGELLVLPRRSDEPPVPLPSRHSEPVAGQEVVHVQPGSVLLFEEQTYHAVTAMRGNHLRGFIGAMLVRPGTLPEGHTDPTLLEAAQRVPELARFLSPPSPS